MNSRTIAVPEYALSIWQPWAHLLACGAKIYETRSWPTKFRGPIAIHAAKHWTVRMARGCYQKPFFTVLLAHGVKFPARCDETKLRSLGLAFGAVVAVGNLVDCVRTEDVLGELGSNEIAFGDFRHGRWAFLYQDVVKLAFPAPCLGRQGFFRLDPFEQQRIEDILEGRSYLTLTEGGAK